MASRKPKPPPKPPRRKRGSGSITRLKSGLWRARLPSTGGGKRQPHDCTSYDEADAWIAAMLAPLPAAATAAQTVGEWAGTWHESYVESVHPPNTAKWYLYALRKLYALYGTPVADVRASMLQAIVGPLTQHLDAATVQGIVGVWRRMFEAAIDDELIARNPAARLTIPRAAPRAVKRHVTPTDVAALWPAIYGTRFEAAFALLIGCGLRIGEVLGLRWEHVDLGSHRAWIQWQWTNGHWRNLPKGRNPHWVNLPPPVVAALIRHRDQQPEGTTLVMQSPHLYHERGGSKRKPSDPKPWAAQTVRNDLVALCESADVLPFLPHAARRGLATVLLDGGASPAIVAERLGHADASTTLRSYAGRSDEARQRADAMVDAYLGNAPEADSGAETG